MFLSNWENKTRTLQSFRGQGVTIYMNQGLKGVAGPPREM